MATIIKAEIETTQGPSWRESNRTGLLKSICPRGPSYVKQRKHCDLLSKETGPHVTQTNVMLAVLVTSRRMRRQLSETLH